MDIQQYIASGVVELYVMGLCSPAEEQELLELRARHPELDKAVADCEADMEKKMMGFTADPGQDTDRRIIDSVKAPVVPLTRSPFRKWKLAAAACLVLLLGSAALNIFQMEQMKKDNSTARLPERDYQVMNDPAITPVAMYGVGIHAICRCTMFWDKKTGKAYIMIHHLPQSSTAKDYQLWAMVDGKPVSIGTLQDDIRGRFIEVDAVPSRATRFVLTLEKAGGSENPTLTEIYLEGQT